MNRPDEPEPLPLSSDSNASARRATHHYATTDLHSRLEGASSHRLISLLLEGAITRLSRALQQIDAGNPAGRGEQINPALQIIDELRASLSEDPRNDVAENLRNFYAVVQNLIVAGNTNNDREPLTRASDMLRELLETWNAIPAAEQY